MENNINNLLQLSIEHERAARENITLARYNDFKIIKRNKPSVPNNGLWKGLWDRSEIACLFGATNVGKSILAMQIAANVSAMGLNVAYFDLENMEHPIKPQFTPTSIQMGDDDTSSPLDFISSEITSKKIQVAIIDDFQRLLGNDDSSTNAVYTLNTLRRLSRSTGVAILFTVHTKEHKKKHVITTQNLPHAYEILHSCDSVFSLALTNHYNATRHQRTHYIKQHKNRMAPVIFNDNCVLTAQLMQHNGIIEFINFEPLGNERQLLRDNGFHSQESINEAIRQLNRARYTTREIAAVVGLSQSQVSRIISRSLPDDLEPEVLKCEDLLVENYRNAIAQQNKKTLDSKPQPSQQQLTNRPVQEPQHPLNQPQPLSQQQPQQLNDNNSFDAFDSSNNNTHIEPNSNKARFNSNSSIKKLIKNSRRK